MKYKFEAIIRGNERINKTFKSRQKADRYLEKVLDSYNLYVSDIINPQDNKHNVEYICDDFNRISINRN